MDKNSINIDKRTIISHLKLLNIKRPRLLEIQALAWDRHNKVAGFCGMGKVLSHIWNQKRYFHGKFGINVCHYTLNMTITTNIYRINNTNLFELVYICIAVEDPSNYQEARVGIPLNGSTNIKRPRLLEIQALAWDRHNKVAGLNRLMESQPSPLDNWMDLQRQYRYKQARTDLYY
jgi:hypothetical protein